MNPVQSPMGRFVERLLRHSRLTGDEQQSLLRVRTRSQQFRAHVDIVSPGETVDHACLIARGLAGRFDQMRDGRRQITALHIPGDMCDLHSVVQPRATWSITALAPTTVVFVPHAELVQLANASPALAMAFWRDTALDSAVLVKWIGNLGRKDARSRVAHLFCEMGLRMEASGLGSRDRYPLPVTQEQLADATGLTAVHVNRTLQRLRDTGAISFRSGTVEILDWEGLALTGQFERDYLFPKPQRDGSALDNLAPNPEAATTPARS